MAISGPANRNEHDEHDQRQVLVGVAIDLGGAWRQDQREHARPVQPRDRDQVEDHEREVREHERERAPSEVPRDARPDHQPADRRQRQVGVGPASDVTTVSRVRLRKKFGSTGAGFA